uniref:Fe2OG dioxygenase domain-containing protein n=1 Tax=Setaria digitata TaxID=48799 RepID=A0A915PPI7_9BILA
MKARWVLTIGSVLICGTAVAQMASGVPSLLVVTVATEETDGLRRLQRTANANGIRLEVLGVGEEWQGGDTRVEKASHPFLHLGGGQKIRILRKFLEKYKRDDLIILFIDAYDVMLLDNEEQILRKFFTFFDGFRIVFSSEPFCWPDRNLAPKYPLVNFGYRYLNSGIFMGFASEIWNLINYEDVEDDDDDQLYYTRLYLDEQIRESLKMTLDSMSILFQNLNGASDDVKLEADAERNEAYFVYNFVYNTSPSVIHGNGPSKLFLNHIGNYIDPLRAINKKTETTAIVLFENLVNSFIEEAKGRYGSLLYDDSTTDIGEREARAFSLKQSYEMGSDYLIMIDGDVHLNRSESLLLLVHAVKEKNIGIFAPLVGQLHNLFTNFWGAISSNGYYARSENYLNIIDRKEVGIWNVPFINSILVIANEKLTALSNAYNYDEKIDPDMSFCSFARNEGHFLYLDNSYHYGFLVISEDIELSKAHPEMYEIFNNRQLWEKRYIHPNYFAALNGSVPILEICQDVYDFPLMSEAFCSELIEECEHYGKWSDGRHKDERLAGGYENVPTRDIHMKQIDFERHWLYMLDEYVRPIQEKLFIGYYKRPVESVMMFVVRYKPEEQASLRPHHDASTYSIDIALNKRGVDYQGGGVHFLRYNCTFDADVVGHSMIFPGRLTHLHEGLETTQGTRYIAVSFINP